MATLPHLRAFYRAKCTRGSHFLRSKIHLPSGHWCPRHNWSKSILEHFTCKTAWQKVRITDLMPKWILAYVFFVCKKQLLTFYKAKCWTRKMYQNGNQSKMHPLVSAFWVAKCQALVSAFCYAKCKIIAEGH